MHTFSLGTAASVILSLSKDGHKMTFAGAPILRQAQDDTVAAHRDTVAAHHDTVAAQDDTVAAHHDAVAI